MQRPGRGFTLVEVLVAVAVLSVIGALAFRGLGLVLDAEARVAAETRRWTDVATAMSHMARDLSLAVPRPTRDEAGRLHAALSISRSVDEAVARLVLARLDVAASPGAAGGVRKVGYRLRRGTLEYMIWPDADALPGSAPLVVPILGDIVDLRLRALGASGAWSRDWPAGDAAVLPLAIEAEVVLAGGERVSRVFALR